jgi:pyrroline-5-carboxylate reductase
MPPLLLIGCGKMGGAMLAGWLEQGLPPETVVVEPYAEAVSAFVGRVRHVASIAEIPADFAPAAVILATKPQEAPNALPQLARFVASAPVFVSIMAGKTVAGMQALLGGDAARVVRAMPNTPAAVRQGFTVGFAGPGVTAEQKALADQLLRAVGDAAWVEDEALIDPVTAVSGGGPAYVFLLVEVMAAAGVAQGLPEELAMRMARATVAGSGALLAASPQDASTLRKNVTSPKGTTERALAVLMDEAAWPDIMKKAIAAATARSKELAG